ncbi:MAG: hypothetical protein LBN93_09580, partial [Candidatus Symbiothrix sp.]|nr:hypothetical protein [Candidatus Symbiothrix sp.]
LLATSNHNKIVTLLCDNAWLHARLVYLRSRWTIDLLKTHTSLSHNPKKSGVEEITLKYN